MTKASQLFPRAVPRIDTKTAERNFHGAPAYRRSTDEQVLQVLLTGTFDNRFYTSQAEQVESARELFTEAVRADPEFFGRALSYARGQGYMRTLPLYGLSLLSAAPPPHFEDALGRVVRTPDDLGDLVAMMRGAGRSVGSRRMARALGGWLRDNLSEYWALKYAHGTAKGRYRLVDLLRLLHPRYGPGGDRLVEYLLGKNEYAEGLPQVLAYEALKRASTEADRARLIREGRLPYSVATLYAQGAGGRPSKLVWRAIAEQMPILALLKHLRTLEEVGVIEEVRPLVEGKLLDARTVRNSKILPYRFMDAAEAVRTGWVADACRGALELAFDNAPALHGRTAILLDCSPSMKPSWSAKMGYFTKVASVMAVALMKKAGGEGSLVAFGGTARLVPFSMRDSILTQAERLVSLEIQATNHSAGLELLSERGERADNLVLITDGEHNTGRPFAEGLNAYRRQVAPDCRVFVVDVSDGRHAVAPQGAPNVHYVYGWSDRVLAYIALASQGWGSIADAVRAGALGADAGLAEVYSGDVIA